MIHNIHEVHKEQTTQLEGLSNRWTTGLGMGQKKYAEKLSKEQRSKKTTTFGFSGVLTANQSAIRITEPLGSEAMSPSRSIDQTSNRTRRSHN